MKICYLGLYERINSQILLSMEVSLSHVPDFVNVFSSKFFASIEMNKFHFSYKLQRLAVGLLWLTIASN